MKNDPICFKHNEIMSICETLMELDFSKPYKKKLQRGLRKIIRITEQAKEDGQNMEDRLQEYFAAMEQLGFKRTKRKK